MGAKPGQPRATYEDLLRLPEGQVGQLVGGELFAAPRPALDHAHVTSTLGMELGGPFQRGRGGPGGWWIIDEPELHLGEDVLVPDLAGWRRSRLPEPLALPFHTLVPDWVCEVLSPSTVRFGRVKKMRVHAREGVPFLWLIDPEHRTLEVFKRQGEEWLARTYGGQEDRLVRAEPFEAIDLELSALWLPEAPPSP